MTVEIQKPFTLQKYLFVKCILLYVSQIPEGNEETIRLTQALTLAEALMHDKDVEIGGLKARCVEVRKRAAHFERRADNERRKRKEDNEWFRDELRKSQEEVAGERSIAEELKK
ncbi:hypothetical protein Y032_0011g1538 [Ancylostoma ceylanicum]|uniref:Uncharacterized protein n=1 Tax=Ancylostoma ceylanicum TaxID=53326 RepID=A0A016VH57_9BILA|nr:hypothetical protein Y032_0011g1538 [Ancylostoma ceylanicum]